MIFFKKNFSKGLIIYCSFFLVVVLSQITCTQPGNPANNPPSITDPSPSVVYKPAIYTFQQGVSINPLVPETAGNPFTNCVSSPILPAGLNINPTNCVIEGAPAIVQGAVQYTITASNKTGTNTANLSITINAAGTPPGIAYSGSPYTFSQNSAITAIVPSLTGNSLTGCTASPVLPAGLSIDTATCTISGTPVSTQTATAYQITATNNFGSGSALISITINAAGTPPGITYSASPFLFTQNVAVTTIVPTLTGNAITGCVSSPALPTGLSINGATCAISGTPVSAQTATAYQITAVNNFGSGSALIVITINAAGTAPGITYSGSPYSFTQNSLISAIVPSLTGNSPTSCTVVPALPSGLSLNGTTCAISGTPVAAQTAVSYQITASNSYGSGSTGIAITVISAGTAPGITYTASPFTFAQNIAITTIVPSLTGNSPTSCNSSPALPSGLSINGATCAISGTPVSAQTATTYRITASNIYGSGSTVIAITVNAAGIPPAITYAGSLYTLIQNSVITTIVPTLTGNTPTSCFSSPALPGGLSINATSCAISGTPLTGQAAANYTITVSNAYGSSSTTINIKVNAAIPAAPTGLFAISKNSSVTIGWGLVSGAVSYNIYWSQNPGVTKTNGAKIGNVTPNYTHSGLNNGTPYYYIVTTVSAGGESLASVEIMATPSESAPPTVAITNLKNNSKVESGFIVGTASDNVLVNRVEVKIDNGAIASATGTVNWKFKLPAGSSGWREGSAHSISVQSVDSSGNVSPLISLVVTKGKNKDINGDGYADLVVGAGQYNTNQGRVYIFYGGSPGIQASTAQNGTGGPNQVITGEFQNSYFGITQAIGDINGDGFADLVVGGYYWQNSSLFGVYGAYYGNVYIFYSAGANGITATTAQTGTNGSNNRISGNSRFGRSIATGDINGDGFDDIAVSATSDPAVLAYSEFFIFLSKGTGGITDTSTMTYAARIMSEDVDDDFGSSVVLKDFNRDGYADLTIASPKKSILKPNGNQTGNIYMFKSNGISGITVSSAAAANSRITDPYYLSGSVVDFGDVNADGFPDLVIGAPRGDGRVLIFHNQGIGGIPTSTSAGANTIITGDISSLSRFGTSIKLADMNNDGIDDLVVGADHSYMSFGKVHIYYSTGVSGIIASNASTGVGGSNVTILGEVNNSMFGSEVSVGDVNGDGYQDLSASAYLYPSYGRVYIFHNSGTNAITATSAIRGAVTGSYTVITGEPVVWGYFGVSLGL